VTATATATPAKTLLPYPGLRPFERDEAHIFFGRETQVDAMVDRFARHRLLVVTGSSGSGKSSLVRAGLLEALETGLLADAGPVWRFATLRPGARPMTELAAALLDALGVARTPDDVALRRAALERGPLSLIEELRERPLRGGGNLLVLVDQFEELFRYRSLAGREEAEAFIALLLASASERSVPIYVVLTMRSDFVGRCAEFDGLAEAVDDAQYLCPRLSRRQIAAAVEGPAKVFKGDVEPRLIARIVNDMGTEPDQLPLMQHALMRLWSRAQAHDPPLLRLDDYVAEGGIKGSLSRHADEILAEITRDMPERAETARRLFCLLVEGEGENAVRRLARVTEVMAVTGKPLDETAAVADPFRAPGRSLLMPELARPLACNTVLDIGHESLIRQWQMLKDWVRTEATSAEQYRDIERRARRWAAGSGAFLDGTDLDVALAWCESAHPSTAWAARYAGDFALMMRFLDESRIRRDAMEAARREQERRIIAAEEAVARQQAEAEAERRRVALEAAEERAAAANRIAKLTRVGLVVLLVLLFIAAGLAWWGLEQTRAAKAALAEAQLSEEQRMVISHQLARVTDERDQLKNQLEEAERLRAEAQAAQLAIQLPGKSAAFGEMFGTTDLIVAGIIAGICALVPAGAGVTWAQVRRSRGTRLNALRNWLIRASGRGNQADVPTVAWAAMQYGFPLFPKEGEIDKTVAVTRIITLQWRDVVAHLFLGFLFTVASAFGFYTIFILPSHAEVWQWPNLLLLGLAQAQADPPVLGRYQEETAVIMSAAFLGAYIWAVSFLLLQATRGFLSGFAFLVATTQIVFACLIAAILRHILAAFGSIPSGWHSALYGVGFAIGVAPILTFLSRAPSATVHRLRTGPTESSRRVPLNVIEGVTRPIRSRLAQANIDEAQNLATSNPVFLWAETSYDLFEIIDWVAQAQLIVAVGPRAATALRDCGIRTVFDFLQAADDEAMVLLLAKILLAEISTQPDAGAVQLLSVSLRENLAVRRLWMLRDALIAPQT
jgi:hypothetical protein